MFKNDIINKIIEDFKLPPINEVREALEKAFDEGNSNGYKVGYNDGFNEGWDVGREG